MGRWRGWWLVALCVLFTGCQPPTPADEATATPPVIEPITVYVGVLQLATATPAQDVVALLVGDHRVRAMVCSLAEQRWQAVDTWFDQGERRDTTLVATSAARHAELTGTFTTPERIDGNFTAADGTQYHFQAQKMITTADYQANAAGSDLLGVYTIAQEPLPDGRMAVMYAAAVPAQQLYCGMLMSAGQPVTRVQLKSMWQASFSEFTLPDPIGADKKTLVWDTPRHILHIEGILVPNP